jgi:protein-disulfide isomerase
VEADRQDGIDLGVEGTPTFFLNGKKLQPSSVQDFRDQIDAALNG